MKLVDYIVKEFEAKHVKGKVTSFRSIPRAMARVKKEAQKVKEVLSANEFFPVVIENIHSDIDFRLQMTRQIFNDLCKDLYAKIPETIDAAILKANITKEQIKGIELVGGGTRVPKVRDILQEYFGANAELGTHLNGDEAMVLGAAYKAANSSTFFRVPRKVETDDILPFGVGVTLAGESEEGEAKPINQMGGLLYPINSIIGTKKKIKRFVRKTDFKVSLYHIENNSASFSASDVGSGELFAVYDVKGFEEMLKTYGKYGDPQIRLEFDLSQNGIPSLERVEALFEEQYEVNVTDDKATSKKDTTNSTSETTDSTTVSGDEANKAESSTSENATAPVTKVITKTRRHITTLTINRIDEGVKTKVMSASAKELAISVLSKWKKTDETRKLRAQTRNELETYLLNSKDKLRSDETNVMTVITESEFESLISEMQDAEDWLFSSEGVKASIKTIKEKRDEISQKVSKINFKLSEIQERPPVVEASKKLFETIKKTVSRWEKERPWITSEERENLIKEVEGYSTWLKEKTEKQETLTPRDEPAFSTTDMKDKIESLQTHIEKLLKKKMPKSFMKPPKVEVDPKSAKSDSSKESETKEADNKEQTEGETKNEESTDSKSTKEETDGESTKTN